MLILEEQIIQHFKNVFKAGKDPLICKLYLQNDSAGNRSKITGATVGKGLSKEFIMYSYPSKLSTGICLPFLKHTKVECSKYLVFGSTPQKIPLCQNFLYIVLLHFV
jgi:hypothetical protein